MLGILIQLVARTCARFVLAVTAVFVGVAVAGALNSLLSGFLIAICFVAAASQFTR